MPAAGSCARPWRTFSSIRLPTSSYLTRGVPAGNFGLMAAAQVGPLEVQTVFAQQKGDVSTKEFRLGTGGQAGVEQDAEIVIDDADYVQGQFFFLVPPSDLAQASHIDVLGLQGADAPSSVRPSHSRPPHSAHTTIASSTRRRTSASRNSPHTVMNQPSAWKNPSTVRATSGVDRS